MNIFSFHYANEIIRWRDAVCVCYRLETLSFPHWWKWVRRNVLIRQRRQSFYPHLDIYCNVDAINDSCSKAITHYWAITFQTDWAHPVVRLGDLFLELLFANFSTINGIKEMNASLIWLASATRQITSRKVEKGDTAALTQHANL